MQINKTRHFRAFKNFINFHIHFSALRTTQPRARRTVRVKNIAQGHLNSAIICCTCKHTSSWVVHCCVISNRRVIPKSMPEMLLSAFFSYLNDVAIFNIIHYIIISILCIILIYIY